MAFYPLTVTHIHRTIRDAVVLTLTPDDPEKFRFEQGQYLTFRHDFDGTELRRNYSICSGLDDALLQVGIKKVDGGAFSSFANTDLRVGDRLEAMPPQGRFTRPLNPTDEKSYLGVAGGSGITPVLSILRSTLTREPKSTFTLIYANRAVNTIMFREELEDLKNHYMGQVRIIHILESGQDIDLFSGRLSDQKCAALFQSWVDVSQIDTAFICGPEPMMLTMSASLQDYGMDKKDIVIELFTESQQGRLERAARQARTANQPASEAQITVEGVTRSFAMEPGQSVLEAALANDLDAPFACKAGVCSTCKARVLEGKVEMLSNHALEDYEVERGLVLTCQSYPLTPHIIVEYDTH